MKQNFTFVLLLLVFTGASFAQEEEDFNFLERPIESYITEVNFPGTGWITSSDVHFTYNSSDLVVEELVKILDYTTFTLKNNSRTTFTYNSASVLQGDLEETWNSTTSSWENEYRNMYTFSGGEISGIITQMWQGGSWVNYSRSSISYSGGLVSEYLDESWDSGSGGWVFSEKADYTYNSGKLESSTDYEWNIGTASWEPTWRETVSRTATTRTTLSENFDGESWENSSLSTATLDSEGFVVEDVEQDWDQGTESWINDLRYSRTKTSEGWVHIILYQSWEDESWTDAGRITFNYRNSLGIIDRSLQNELVIYPNPAKNSLNISGFQGNTGYFKIFNLNGQLVKNEKIYANENQIDVSGLNNGTYILKAENGLMQSSVKKFVKQ